VHPASRETATGRPCGFYIRRSLHCVLVGVLVLAQAGCSAIEIQRPSWRKPVGKGTWIPAVVCGAIGAGVGVAIQNERQARSSYTNPDTGDRVSSETDKDLWKGAVIGAPIGAAVCAILGHVFLDPTPEPTLPPPPPPVPTPEPTPEPLKRRIVLRGVNFDFDRSDIRADARPVLDHAADILMEQADVQVLVAGHTDSIGSAEYNLGLSIRRAEAVFRYLVNRGIAPERMRTKGFGKTEPVADNSTETGRAQNRRVELRVMP
jgi:OOP family OmpA-OmpF porin